MDTNTNLTCTFFLLYEYLIKTYVLQNNRQDTHDIGRRDRLPTSDNYEDTMVLEYILSILPQSHAIRDAGPLERAFFTSVYRLVFFNALSTSDNYLLYRIFRTSVRILGTLLVCLEIWHLVGDELRLEDIIFGANVTIIHLISVWKITIMASKKDVFNKLAKALDSPNFDITTQRRKDIVKHWAETHKKYLYVVLIIAYPTYFVWQLYPMFDEEKFNLMVDLKVPFEYDAPLRYVLTYIAVGTVFHYVSFMVMVCDVLMQAYLVPLICQFDVLADCFENIFDECAAEFQASFPEIDRDELVNNNLFVDKYLKRLSDLVTRHQAVLKQAVDLKAILSAPMLGQLVCSGLIICLVGYQATATMAANLGRFFQSLLYLSYTMFSLYLLCRWCEEIASQSQHIGESAYFSGWESGISQAPGVRAAIMLVIARSNTPLVFFAGGMYPLSLTTYSTVVKASYSALNLLLTTND